MRGAAWLTVLATACLLAASPVAALDVRVGWSPVQGVAGYRLYVRQLGQGYTGGVDVGLLQADGDGVVRYVSVGLPLGVTNYFAVTAYDASGGESGLSNELSLLVTATPTAGVAATGTPTASRTATANPAVPTATATRTPTRTAFPPSSASPTPTRSPVGTEGSGPVAAYAFSEGSGTTTADASGNGHSGTLFGNPVWTSGTYGTGLQFSGGTTYDGVNLAPNNGFDGLSQGTLEAWVQFDTSAPTGIYDWFSGRDAAGCSYPFELDLRNQSGTVYWNIWAGDTAQCTATFHARVALANPGEWHHLAYVVSSTGNTWYVDGVAQTPTYLIGSAATTFFFGSIAASPSTRYDVGATDVQAGTFKGTIDDLRIYARPLTQAEIQADMNTPADGTIPGSGVGVSGSILYYSDGAPVPGATVTLSGMPGDVTATTDAAGQYGFADVSTGTWLLTPEKQGDVGEGISSLDAAYVLQAVGGLRSFDAQQILACDVTGNGTLSALDAVRILELSVGEIGRLPVAESCGSDWAFVPEPMLLLPLEQLVQPLLLSTTCQPGALLFDPLLSDAAQQDFTAVMFGDCTGNWSAAESGAALRQLARPARTYLGRARARPGRRWIIPIHVAGRAALEAFEARIGYDPAAASLEAVKLVGARTEAILNYRTDSSGLVAVALASARSLALGKRPLLVLVFSAADTPQVRLFDAVVDDTAARVIE